MGTHEADRSTFVEPVRRITLGAWRASLLPRQRYEARYTPAIGVIGFAFEGQSGVHAFASAGTAPFSTRPNSLAYVPRGCDVFSRSPNGGEYLTLESSATPEPCRSWVRFNNRVLPEATRAAYLIRRGLLSDHRVDPLQLEAAFTAMEMQAARVLGGHVSEPRACRWMTAARWKRIDEIIEAEMHDRLTVKRLSDALGLSERFFRRAFKATAGKAPHDYILDRRISRARWLICAGKKDLSAIALDSGFCSHAHLTAAFRKRLGTTPSAVRRASLDGRRRS